MLSPYIILLGFYFPGIFVLFLRRNQFFLNLEHKKFFSPYDFPEEIANSIHEFFPDMELDSLVTVVERYQSIDAWAADPILTEDSLNNLMEVMELAGQLDNRAPYSVIVDTSYAENAVNNLK